MSMSKLVTMALLVCALLGMVAAGCGDSGNGANKPVYGPGSTGHLGSAAIASQQAG